MLCGLIRVCPSITNGDALAKILYDLSIGGLTSLMFYFLLVKIPEWTRRERLKRSLKQHYRAFKHDMISTIVGVADGSYSVDTVERLMDQTAFRAYFKEQVTPDQNRWHQFMNKLDDYHMRRLLTHMEIFREEVLYILNATDISSDEPFEFLKRLSAIIREQNHVDQEYDTVKSFAGFLWILLTGWDWSSGYRQDDIIEKMISAI